MFDFKKLLNDLQGKAESAVNEIDVDAQVESAKDAARKVRERLENDPDAQKAALGGGALLMLLMATSGGRKLVGTVAKTGAVAAMGALAYKAWQERNGQSGEVDPEAAAAAGFLSGDDTDPDFSKTLIETMAVAAHADGVIDPQEMEAIDAALKDAGLDMADLDLKGDQDAIIERLAKAARTPNHAAQLYTAASLATSQAVQSELVFLDKMAARLGIADAHAREIRTIASS